MICLKKFLHEYGFTIFHTLLRNHLISINDKGINDTVSFIKMESLNPTSTIKSPL